MYEGYTTYPVYLPTYLPTQQVHYYRYIHTTKGGRGM